MQVMLLKMIDDGAPCMTDKRRQSGALAGGSIDGDPLHVDLQTPVRNTTPVLLDQVTVEIHAGKMWLQIQTTSVLVAPLLTFPDTGPGARPGGKQVAGFIVFVIHMVMLKSSPLPEVSYVTS